MPPCGQGKSIEDKVILQPIVRGGQVAVRAVMSRATTVRKALRDLT